MGSVSLSVQVIYEAYGLAATGVTVRLDRATHGGWTELSRSKTDEDGQIRGWHCEPTSPGTYRLEFGTDAYFSSLGITPFYPTVTVEFRMPDPGYPYRTHLLLTPSSYLVYWQH